MAGSDLCPCCRGERNDWRLDYEGGRTIFGHSCLNQECGLTTPVDFAIDSWEKAGNRWKRREPDPAVTATIETLTADRTALIAAMDEIKMFSADKTAQDAARAALSRLSSQ